MTYSVMHVPITGKVSQSAQQSFPNILWKGQEMHNKNVLWKPPYIVRLHLPTAAFSISSCICFNFIKPPQMYHDPQLSTVWSSPLDDSQIEESCRSLGGSWLVSCSSFAEAVTTICCRLRVTGPLTLPLWLQGCSSTCGCCWWDFTIVMLERISFTPCCILLPWRCGELKGRTRDNAVSLGASCGVWTLANAMMDLLFLFDRTLWAGNMTVLFVGLELWALLFCSWSDFSSKWRTSLRRWPLFSLV